MKKFKIGYTTGVYDMFHVGHLNLLKNAKNKCDYLIVGVSTDQLVTYKDKKVIIPHHERVQMIEGCKYVDKVVTQHNMDKIESCLKYKADVVFVGDDWKGSKTWVDLEKELLEKGIELIYLPYTKNVSSTQIIERVLKESKS